MYYVIGIMGFIGFWFIISCGVTAIGDFLEEVLGQFQLTQNEIRCLTSKMKLSAFRHLVPCFV